jgi:tRNA(Arg) A34 adenosine deaminase TadA
MRATRREAIARIGQLPAFPSRAAESGSAEYIARAFEMRRRAEAAGDQPYGAVVARNGAIIGEAASAVIGRRDPDAHAERLAIADAQHRLGRSDLGGAVLYSSSRPCARCETAAARAGIARMVYGTVPTDAGRPEERTD